LLLFFVARSYLQAYGRTGPLVTAMVVANILNFGGDLLLIPPLGVAGAALATTICTIAEVAIVAVPLRALPTPRPQHVSHRIERRDVAAAFHIGLPIGLQLGAEVGIFALVGLLAARAGTVQLAAHQVAISLASFTFTMALGVAAAGSVRLALAIGPRGPQRTRRAGPPAFAGGAVAMRRSAALLARA